MKYDLVFLDADDTLFDFEAAEAYAFEGACSDFKLTCDSSEFLLYKEINHALWKDLEKGLVNQEILRVERFRRFFKEINTGINPNEFAFSFANWLGKGTFLLPGAEELCRNLAGKITQVILTNGIRDVQESRLRLSVLSPWIDHLVISEEVGCQKPNPGIFEYALKKVGAVPRKRMIIVGDSLTSDIQGGVNFGIDTCWFNPGRKPRSRGLDPTFEISKLSDLEEILTK
jgi:2-haloacid dehalogenase